MIVSINQPAYLPWLGYFHRIATSDIHIVLDHVQFEKNSVVNRNRIRTKQGWIWLTVPLRTKGRFGDLGIDRVEINNGVDWKRKHWRSLCLNYGSAPHYDAHAELLRDIYAREWTTLSDLLRAMLPRFLECLGIRTQIVYSSTMEVTGKKSELILNLCRLAKADVYLSGSLGREYLDEEAFRRSNIAVAYQEYRHPTYSQVFRGFEPNMSVVDLIFNEGAASSSILMSGNEGIDRR